MYLLAESPADLTAYVLAPSRSEVRADLERRGKVTRYTEPPLVTVVLRAGAEVVVDVWNGPLSGKQRYISAADLEPPK